MNSRTECAPRQADRSSHSDGCVGRILEALDQGPHRHNTIVVVCGDNGYEFGEKNNWSKGTLRERSAHVPLVMAGPNIAGGLYAVATEQVSHLQPTPTTLQTVTTITATTTVSFSATLDPAAATSRRLSRGQTSEEISAVTDV